MSKEYKKAKRRKKALFYRIGFPLVKLFHGRQKVLYEEAVDPGEPVIFVANHAQAFGPISMIVNFDRTVRPWIAADVMFKETAADFVFVQFFAGNIKKHKRWNMFKARFVGRALVAIFANVGGIPVYFDRRLIKTRISQLKRELEQVKKESKEKQRTYLNSFGGNADEAGSDGEEAAEEE